MLRLRFMRAAAVSTVMALAAGLLVAVGVLIPTAGESAAAAAGSPGTPSAPVQLYLENFENGTATSVQEIENYTGASGATYTADPYWLRAMRCNGFIVEYNVMTTTPDGYCNKPLVPLNNWNSVRRKTYALGLLTNTMTTNRAVSSNTSGYENNETAGPDGTISPANGRQFATVGQLNFPVANRFVTFSVDAAATACQLPDPLLHFYLRTDAGAEMPVTTSPINPCTDPRSLTTTVDGQVVKYGSFAANGSFLMTGPTFGIVLRNEQASSSGNDGAFDNIRVLDVTPQLDKSFSPASVPVNGTSTLTLTVTNTSELAAKSGWSFTDNLPTGLVVDDPASVGGTCNADTTATAGSSTITVTNGVLTTAETSCTIKVNVTSDTPAPSEASPKVYQNCAQNISKPIGINLPNCASVEFFNDPELTIKKTSTANADSRPGDKVNYTVTATNTGTQNYTATHPAVVFDDLAGVLDDATFNDDAQSSVGSPPSFSSPLLSWSGALPVGQSVTLTYSVTLTAAGNGTLRNVAWIPKDPSTPTTPTCDPPVDGRDTDTGEPCATTAQALPRLSIEKSANRTDLPAVGEKVTYTIVVTNDGPGDYTATAPASATDDLTKVLDDATFDTASLTADVGLATRTGNTLSWSGVLASKDSATIKYSVTYTGAGNNRLTNLACVPSDSVTPGEVRCATVSIPGAALQRWKTATPSSSPLIAGSTITYTLFFDNDGQAAANVDAIDDLTHILDDTEITTAPTSADGLTVNRNGAKISITGSVPAGERYTVTYTATVRSDADRGDSIAANFLLDPGGSPPENPVCDPANPALPDCTSNSISGIAYTKAVKTSATPVLEGTKLTYTVTVTNTGATTVAVNRDDNLADVLDDATITTSPDSDTASVTVDGPTAGVLAIRGTLPVNKVAKITYTATVKALPDRGNSRAANYLVSPGTTPPESCDPAAEQCTRTPIQGYTVSKTANTTKATPGQSVTYTVSVTNTGTVDFTEAAPATFTDDLSEVRDDATYNNDISAGGSVTGDNLSWAGALVAGDTKTVTYSVTVNKPRTGDGTLTNAVVATAPGGQCQKEGGCVVETPVSSFTVAKAADKTTALPGDVITYTITVENTGKVDYTSAAPASFNDNLAGVLDDATYNDNASAGALNGTTFTWSGPVATGKSVTVKYSVTVADPIRGNQDLLNTVTPNAPGGSCVSVTGCATTTPVGSYTVTKSVDTATAHPGDEVTYTLTVKNTGKVDYTSAAPATLTDDLSGVLDDAAYNNDASSGATVSGSTLRWSDALAANQSVTITYSVTVDDPVTGDFVLRNTATPTGPGGSCADSCETVTPLSSFRVVKSADTTEVVPGEKVTYTITVTNTGKVAYTETSPASFSDDLSNVLDDAAYNNDANSSTGMGVTYTDPTLAWEGALGINDTVTITYSATINNPATGDERLENTVVTPPASGGNCAQGSTDPACVSRIPSGSFTVEKTVNTETAGPGDVVVYTVTVKNTGKVAYTTAEPASFSDDLSRVLDDAAYNDDVSEGGAVSGSMLTWSRPLAVGEIIEVTYSVTVDDPVTGNFALRNVVSPTAPGGACGTAGCVTDTPIASFTVAKDADVDDVVLGEVVTYTVTVTNTGGVDYTDEAPASFRDDLTAVLDDATYNDDATRGATMSGSTLNWSGALTVGGTVTVTYSVTVNQPATGDRLLRNAVVPGDEGVCAVGSDCVIETPVATYEVVKKAASANAAIGDRLAYTITVTNTGRVPYTDDKPATFTDDLSSALAIATYNNDASGGATYERPVLSWSGTVGVGESVTINYSVMLREAGTIRNVVVTPKDSAANCSSGSTDSDCTTTTTVVPPGLAITGSAAWISGGAASALLIALGAWLVVRRRRLQDFEALNS